MENIKKIYPNTERLLKNIELLGEIGKVENEGIYRTAFSECDLKGREWVDSLMKGAGLDTRIDEVGNLIGKLEGKDPQLPVLILGSHIDTVENGGKFDGALGVLAGIECCRTLKESNITPKHTIEVIAFSDEEGTVTGGSFGSRAMMGDLTDGETMQLSDSTSELSLALKKAGLDPQKASLAKKDLSKILAYLELHVEQGGVLDEKSVPIGAVTGIVGINRYNVVIPGTSNHAGTTPMHLRDDALVKSAKFILDTYELGCRQKGKAVITTGMMDVFPGAFNIIPGEIRIGVESRSLDHNLLQELEMKIKENVTKQKGSIQEISHSSPVKLDKHLHNCIKEFSQQEGLACLSISSGAGHDCESFADKVASGMIFIPSKDGISHSPNEYVEPQYIKSGLRILWKMCSKLSTK